MKIIDTYELVFDYNIEFLIQNLQVAVKRYLWGFQEENHKSKTFIIWLGTSDNGDNFFEFVVEILLIKKGLFQTVFTSHIVHVSGDCPTQMDLQIMHNKFIRNLERVIKDSVAKGNYGWFSRLVHYLNSM